MIGDPMSTTNERFEMPPRNFGQRLSEAAGQAFLILMFPVVVTLIILGGFGGLFQEVLSGSRIS